MESIIVMDLQEQVKELKELIKDYEAMTFRLHPWYAWKQEREALRRRACELGIVEPRRKDIAS